MINFDLENTAIFQNIKWSKRLLLKNSHFLKSLFLIIFSVFFVLFLIGFLGRGLDESSLSHLLGFSILFFLLFIFFKILNSFFDEKVMKLDKRIDGSPNLAERLSFSSANAVLRSIKFAKKRKVSEISSTILLYFLLKENPNLKFVFTRALISYKDTIEEVKKAIEDIKGKEKKPVFSENLQKVIEDFPKEKQKIMVGDVLSSLAKFDPVFREILVRADLNAKDIRNLTLWLTLLKKQIKEEKKWWEYKNLLKRGSLARDWASGYTINMDRYSIDWFKFFKKKMFNASTGHEDEVRKIERILFKGETNNVLLIGKPGTGRKSAVMQFAQKSFLGESLPNLNYKRVIELDLSSLVSEIKSTEEVEAVLSRIFNEAVSAGNVILVIPEIHNYLKSEEKAGILDISGIILSYLRLPQFQVIGITNYRGLHENIEKKPAILNLFGKVELSEISPEQALTALEDSIPFLEKKYKKFISYPALRDIVSYCERYLSNLPFPKKSQDILEEAVILLSRTRKKILGIDEIAQIVSEKTKIPVGRVMIKEKEILLDLENLIHQRIINQNIAVGEISAALRRARSGIRQGGKPMGTFLFLGPTGVGKTETSKALAQIYFGSEDKMIRFDMSEFQQTKDLSRLIGSIDVQGLLSVKARENPFSLILLDEIEKAHPDVLNLFLQILDEGTFRDGFGRKVDLKNTIIIATSNAGYQMILDAIKEKTEWSSLKTRILDHLFETGIFRPEFVNRFDGVVIFNPLSKENLLGIAGLQFAKLKKNLSKKNIEFVITDSLKERIAELSYNPQFGAREMKRVIQNKVEDVLAKALLGEEIKKGDKIKIDPETFKIIKVF